MIILDTNVLLRLFLDDDPKQQHEVKTLDTLIFTAAHPLI